MHTFARTRRTPSPSTASRSHWLPAADVRVVAGSGGHFTLTSSTGAEGLRLLILPIDADTFLTIEYLTASGLDDFLPASGIAVHRIDLAPAACGRPADGPTCRGIDRVQTTMGSAPPHLELLSRPGESWEVDQWSIALEATGAVAEGGGAEVAVRATDR